MNNEKEIKPSERIEQLAKNVSSGFTNVEKLLHGVVAYMNEQHAKKSAEEGLMPRPGICPYCKGDVSVRNPTGNCDHLYYPDNVNKDYKQPSPSSEPSIDYKQMCIDNLEQGWKDYDKFKELMLLHPDWSYEKIMNKIKEPLVDGKEVSELKILSNRLQKLKDKCYYNPDEIATCLISEGYSKQPAQQSSLVPLDENKLYGYFKVNVYCSNESFSDYVLRIIPEICQKFGRPRTLSVEEIKESMITHGGDKLENWLLNCMSEAIHNELVKEE